MISNKIGVIGLGKLGLPMFTSFLLKGFNVKGYDNNTNIVNNLQNGIITTKEAGIKEAAKTINDWNERFVSTIKEIYDHSDTLFIIVPTPSNEQHIFDVTSVQIFLQELVKISNNNKKVTAVVTSTVNPGDCDNFLQIIKNTSIELCYSPEFIALGSVLRDLLNPDICLIGSNKESVAEEVTAIYRQLYNTTPEHHYLSYKEAEIAKISINSFVTTKISFANTIGSFVYNTTGSTESVKRTLKAISADKRIGSSYFKFGPGFGGPCFPRDNKCLAKHLLNSNIPPTLPLAVDSVNSDMISFFTTKLELYKYKNIVYLGVSYKPGSEYIGESFILSLHQHSYDTDKNYYYYDNNVDNITNFKEIRKVDSIEAIDSSDTLYIVNYCDKNILNNIKQGTIYKLWA